MRDGRAERREGRERAGRVDGRGERRGRRGERVEGRIGGEEDGASCTLHLFQSHRFTRAALRHNLIGTRARLSKQRVQVATPRSAKPIGPTQARERIGGKRMLSSACWAALGGACAQSPCA